MGGTANIIITLAACMVYVAIMGFLLWKKRHNGKKDFDTYTQNRNKRRIKLALRELNCKAEWKKTDEDNLTGSFSYQSGNFKIRLFSHSPYVTLSFLYFFEAEPDNLEIVRAICNQCNLHTESSFLAYSVRSDSGTVDVHIFSNLLLTDHHATAILRRAMGDIFRWRNLFSLKYEELKKNSASEGKRDLEKDSANQSRELFIVREQEMIHQDGGPDRHSSAAKAVHLCTLLNSVMDLTDIVTDKLEIWCEDKRVVHDDPNAIPTFDISEVLIADGGFKAASAMASLTYYDPRDPVKQRRLIMNFSTEGQTVETLYYRVTISIVPLSVESKGRFSSGERRKLMNSVLLGYDLSPNENRLQEFRYLRKEALAKIAAGDSDHLTEEERLIGATENTDLAYLLFNGKVLYQQKRFYEAVLLLEHAFDVMQPALQRAKDDIREVFVSVSYLIGAAYNALGQYRKASYFLQITIPARSIIYTETYINCLVNSGDFRALDIIESWLHGLQSFRENSSEPSAPEITSFMNFLKRRKAFLLVNQRRYGEAEQLLHQLLREPENSNFALHELAYIQKNKEKE